MKVVFCTLYMGDKPLEEFRKSLEDTLPAIENEGWEHQLVVETNCPYISAARAKVLKKAYMAEADYIVFLDYDLSWTPESMVRLLSVEGDVVAGTYRFKKQREEYMGSLVLGPKGGLFVRDDGCIKASKVPAGFLRVSKKAIEKFALSYPELLFGSPMDYALDMFNHGVINGTWYGEDYAFSHRWSEKCGDIWLVPDLDISHHRNGVEYKGNFHNYLKNYNKPTPIDSAPLVSVVIPAYNYGRFLPEAIDSVLSQTYQNVEIIVVDDGSTDDTFTVCKSYGDKIRYYYKQNGGSASARNYGIERSNGQWILCLDSDDKLRPKYIESCLSIKDADIVSTYMTKFGNESDSHDFSLVPEYEDFVSANQIHCASMFRREVWEKTGGFDSNLGSMYDDWEFWLHATKLGFEVKVVPQRLFLYRKHGPSCIDKAVAKHKELYNYMAKKHGLKEI